MDGIKPTIADLNDDQTPVYDPVKVDLLHPSGPATTEPTVPQPARVAPITPPMHAVPESNVEIVQNQPAPTPPTEPMPVVPQRVPDSVPPPIPAPIHDNAPTPPAAPVVSETQAIAAAPVEKTSHALRNVGLLLLIPIALGIAAYFIYFHKKVVVVAPAGTVLTAVAPTSLIQQNSSGAIAPGGQTSTTPTFGATLTTSAKTGSASLQVEVEPMATAFSGTPTVTGSAVSATGSALTLTAKPSVLSNGPYHWQARTKVGAATSAWVVENTTGTTTPDFTIAGSTEAAAVPTPLQAPTITAVGGGSVSGLNLTTSQNQPQLSGKTDAGTSLTITVTPDNITLTPKIAADGTWTATPAQTLANGAHTLALTSSNTAGTKSQASYTLNVNPVVTSTTPPVSTPAAPAAAAPVTPTPAPVNTTALAPTGDPTQPLTLIATIVGLIAVAGLIFLRRFDRHERG